MVSMPWKATQMVMPTSGSFPANTAGTQAQMFPRTRSQRIHEARQQFFEEGLRPTGLVGESVIQSWMRCAAARQQPRERLQFNAVTPSRMHAVLARNEQLMSVARQEIQTMEAVLSGMECRVLLTDGQGVIVHGTHNPMAAREPLLNQATRVGVNLVEARLGTTAPGISTHSSQPCTVTGAEHYYECLSSLECAAAPIRDVHGQLAAVLDITVEGRSFNFDAASIVGVYATSIENRLLLAQSVEHLVIRFQASPALLATPMEALVGINSSGQVAWLNAAATRLLGAQALGVDRDVLTLLGMDLVQALAMTRQVHLTPLHLPNGLCVWAQASMQGKNGLDFGHSLAVSAPAWTSVELPSAFTAPESQSCTPFAAEDDMPADVDTRGQHASKRVSLSEQHHHLIDSTLESCGGNISRAARALGVSRGVLYRHLRNRNAESPNA